MKDKEFITDHSTQIMRSVPISLHFILLATLGFILSFIIWANFAVLDEVTRGEARVIPSRNLQVVQNLEGGILQEIKVSEGQIVEKDQILLVIDDTIFASGLRENNVSTHALQIKMLRLAAEAQNKPFEVSNHLIKIDPARVDSERNLFNSRRDELSTKLKIYDQQRKQKQQELAELNSRAEQLNSSLSYVEKELALSKPLLAEGIVSEVEVLRLERTLSELKGELKTNKLVEPRLKTAINEYTSKMQELKLNFKTEALNEFNNTRNELKRLQEDTVALEDKVNRTLVRSPVKGTVNQIKHKTIGGVVQGGQELVEIVPLEDNLLIEAKIKPQDIGFLAIGMPATVKISAYDYSIYGGLNGIVDNISADAILGQNGETFFKVIILTHGNKLLYKGKELSIMPGMSASVDILTGTKTVMDYILKPLLKTKHNALTER